MNPGIIPPVVANLVALQAKVDKWNEESAKKPGSKVRIYTVNPDGSIEVEDRPRGV